MHWFFLAEHLSIVPPVVGSNDPCVRIGRVGLRAVFFLFFLRVAWPRSLNGPQPLNPNRSTHPNTAIPQPKKDDMFGLRTVDERGGILFNTTAGNHLQFSLEQLTWWVNNYFVE